MLEAWQSWQLSLFSSIEIFKRWLFSSIFIQYLHNVKFENFPDTLFKLGLILHFAVIQWDSKSQQLRHGKPAIVWSIFWTNMDISPTFVSVNDVFMDIYCWYHHILFVYYKGNSKEIKSIIREYLVPKQTFILNLNCSHFWSWWPLIEKLV